MKLSHIAAQLRAAGFPVGAITEADSQVDGEIEITKSISIQVAENESYFSVVEQVGDEYKFGAVRPQTVRGSVALLLDLAKALGSASPFDADEAAEQTRAEDDAREQERDS